MLWPVLFFSKVATVLAKHSKFIATVVAFFLWLVGFIDLVVKTAIIQITDAIASIDISAFQSVSLASLEYIGYVNAVLPLTEFVFMMTAYVTAWLTVILIRWIKSFVPTVAN